MLTIINNDFKKKDKKEEESQGNSPVQGHRRRKCPHPESLQEDTPVSWPLGFVLLQRAERAGARVQTAQEGHHGSSAPTTAVGREANQSPLHPTPMVLLGLMEDIKQKCIERTSPEPASSKKARQSHPQVHCAFLCCWVTRDTYLHPYSVT